MLIGLSNRCEDLVLCTPMSCAIALDLISGAKQANSRGEGLAKAHQKMQEATCQHQLTGRDCPRLEITANEYDLQDAWT
jgi:hypothetical protein